MIIKRTWLTNIWPLKLALLLLWLALTGGYMGWEQPAFLAINLLGFLALAMWRLDRENFSRVDLALFNFIGVMALSAVYNGAIHGLLRVIIWGGYVGVYALARDWEGRQINRAALLALIPYLVFSFFAWENPNIVAANLVGLTLMAYTPFLWPIVATMTYFGLSSIGGVLAMYSGLIYYIRRPNRVLVMFSTGAFGLTLGGWMVNHSGYLWRIRFWEMAAAGFWANPWLGIGPGQFYTLTGGDWMHAHNIIATTAAEMGLLGLLALGWLLWEMGRRFAGLPSWAAAVVAAYGAWSLVDEPLHFFGAGFIFFVALSQRKGGDSYGERGQHYAKTWQKWLWNEKA